MAPLVDTVVDDIIDKKLKQPSRRRGGSRGQAFNLHFHFL